MQPSKTQASEADKFRQFTAKVLSVPKAEIDRREAEYQKGRKAKRPPRITQR